MHLDLIQSISLAGDGTTPNDDRAGLAHAHGWVIDGATDLGAPGLLGERGGAAWLSSTADAIFANADGTMAGICEQLYAGIAQRFGHDRRREPESLWEWPCASFAAVTVANGTLDCAFVGDCVVLTRGKDGVRFVTPPPDRATESAEAAALGPGVGATKLRAPAVLADRRASREREGRKVLSIDAAASRAAVSHVQAPVATGDDILLMSDGFAALIDSYAVHDDASLFAAVHEKGLAALAIELRAIEAEDAACLRYPRFKKSDDATALWARVG